MDAEAKKPVEPVAFADVHVVAEDGSVDVVLAGSAPEPGRSLGADPFAHTDEITTALEPKLIKGGAASVATLTGYRLSKVNDPGDVLVTYVLLLESTVGASAVKAIWWENHQEVPTRLYSGEGTLGESRGGARSVVLNVADADGTKLTVEGTLRLP